MFLLHLLQINLQQAQKLEKKDFFFPTQSSHPANHHQPVSVNRTNTIIKYQASLGYKNTSIKHNYNIFKT